MPVTVSAIVPIYNGARWLAATVESLLRQTWPCMEIILVDDGSIDNSLEIARSFESDCVRIISQKNKGGSAARNKGFNESTGEFIQFLDQDDLLAVDKIENQVRLSYSDRDVALSGRWIRFKEDEKTTFGGWGPHSSIARDLSPLDWLLCSHMMPTCAWLTPRELIEAAGFWNEELKSNPDDDGEFFMRVVGKSRLVRFCSSARSYFRSGNPSSAGENRSSQALESIFRTCHTFRDTITRLENSSRTRAAIARRFAVLMYMAYPAYPDLVHRAESEVRSLGLKDVFVPDGTVTYRFVANFVGWKLARRFQVAWYRFKSDSQQALKFR
jgi:glycosyltransferase involved in cell wall biosynthesis